MKRLIAFFLLTASFGLTWAQDFPKPKQGAKIYLESYEVTIDNVEEATLDLWLVRSKRASKAKFELPKFNGSKELEIVVTRDEQNPDHYVATIDPKGVKNGKYFYTVSGGSAGSHKITGTTISIIVGNNASMVSKNNR